MSEHRCHACDVQYRSASFVPGRVDVCLNCAAENPNLVTTSTLLFYRLTRKGSEIHSEVICERHYAQEARPGHSMGPLHPNETERAGYKQTVTPYSGSYPCAMCEDAAAEAAGAYDRVMGRVG